MKDVFYLLIFPGLVFSVITGGLLSWYERKITARFQFRKGPPLLQSFYDIGKLMGKETIIPKYGSRMTFLTAPVFGLTGSLLLALLVLLPVFHLSSGFKGDVIVIFYMSMVPSVAFMTGALASGNPLASIGASREMKLMIGYELTFLLVLAGVVIKSGMGIQLSGIIDVQQEGNVMAGSISGILLLVAAIFCLQAKLGNVPFDTSEADTEIMHGIVIEYSGTSLALIRLTRYIMLFVLPVFIIALFFRGLDFNGIHILWSVLKVLCLVFLVVLIRNINPRLTIGNAMRFFFLKLNALVILAIVLSLFKL